MAIIQEISNDTFRKFSLFLVSYIPLYLWLLLSSFNYNHTYHVIFGESESNLEFRDAIINLILLLFIIYSLVWLRCFLKKEVGSEISIDESAIFKPNSDSLMNYIITYFTPLLTFDRTDNKSLVMNVLLFLLIGFLYSNGNATFLNPVFGLFGYKVYEVENLSNTHHVITKLTYNLIRNFQSDQSKKVIKTKIADGVFIYRINTN